MSKNYIRMSKNYLIVGDVQAKRENLHLVKQLFTKVEEIGLDVIWLGDMLDRRGLIEAECLNAYYEYFKYSNHSHLVIVGNHDLINMYSKETALLPLKSLQNVNLVTQPEYIIYPEKTIMVPYYKDPKEFLKDISNYDSGVQYLIGHQGVKELTIGSGYQENEAVDLSSLKQFKQVIMGHYHTPQEKDNVVFLGSPFSHSFSESNETKRLGIFNEEDGLISYIDMDFPRHMTYNINCNAEPWFQKFDSEPLASNYNRCILTGFAENIAKFDKSAYPYVKFIEQPDIEESKSVIKETESHDVMFKKWLNEVKQEDDMDIESVGLEILKEVK